jgi:thioredoxin
MKIITLLIALATLISAEVIEIKTVEQFNAVVAQKDQLLVFDLYADWCKPCKLLSPILEEVSQTHEDRAKYYKINTENLPQISQAFQVNGIPYVVFFKNDAIVNSLTGLYPKEAYEQYSEIFSNEMRENADGNVKEGLREITIPAGAKIGNIFAYRGDKIKLTIKANSNKNPFSISLPNQNINEKSDGKQDIVVTFKVKELGAFPLFCNGNCVNDGGEQRGWLLVMDYGQSGEPNFKDVEATEFAKLIKTDNTVLLDVRTPNEYSESHIDGAILIPVQQLEARLNELAGQKNKQILIYCRSGNRSTVASKILIDAGFTSVVNLKSGIRSWISTGLKVVK